MEPNECCSTVVESRVNLVLPEGQDTIPIFVSPTYTLHDLRLLAADFVGTQHVSLYTKNYLMDELYPVDCDEPEKTVQSTIENDTEIFVVVTTTPDDRWKRTDPPGPHAKSDPPSSNRSPDSVTKPPTQMFRDDADDDFGGLPFPTFAEHVDLWNTATDADETPRRETHVPPPVTNPPSPPPPETQTPNIAMDGFLDPITFALMADPVVCSDGHTYDRPTIERHFAERRQAALEQQQGNSDTNNDESTCCGANRTAIQLTSPLTGNPVASTLIPNRHVEQQIVGYVEDGSFAQELSEDDLGEWRKRREDKAESDRIRMEHEQMERETAERQRQNAAEAQKRREAEGESGSNAPAPTADPEDWSTAFRLDRTHASPHHLGLAVPFCSQEAKMDKEYFLSTLPSGTTPRCMVTCCANCLDVGAVDVAHCDRCGRPCCSACLEFAAVGYQDATIRGNICTECVMQLADAMPREGETGRARAMILHTKLSRKLEAIYNRAEGYLDISESRLAEERFGDRILDVQAEIRDLGTTQQDLQREIYQAETEAQRARDDAGVQPLVHEEEETEQTVEEWSSLRDDIENRLDELLDQIPPSDEDGQVHHIQAISDLQHRLEEATVNMVAARSRVATVNSNLSESVASTDSTGDSTNVPLPPVASMSISELQQHLSELELEIQTKTNSSNGQESGDLDYILVMSTLNARMDEVQTRLLQAVTEEPTPSINPSHSPAIDQLEQAQREYFALISQMEHTHDHGAMELLVTRISALETILQSAQDSRPDTAPTITGNSGETVVEDSFEDWWQALHRTPDGDWPLPFDLVYPPPCMTNHIEMTKIRLNQFKLQRQTYHENRYNLQMDELNAQKDALEDRIAQLRAQVSSAQESAAEEQERLAARRERHQREQEERRRRDEERLERERQIRAEEEQLRAKHEQDEAATREALQSAVGSEDNATLFGGRGDLRMCAVCKAGPVENFACTDLEAHNDASTTYKGHHVESTSNPNACPHCGFFAPHWHSWPKWDGIMGPH